MNTTTFGTNDGCMGCMRALGVRFLNYKGNELDGAGRDLARVANIDTRGIDERISDCKFTVMCDVTNPLCGENGAAYTFAKQKGADDSTLDILEQGMQNYRDVINRQFGVDCNEIRGVGAAGDFGAALYVFCGGKMKSGINTVLDLIGFNERLNGVDFVITGEGQADSQNVCGKVMQGIGLRAKAHNIPVIRTLRLSR